jgi:hypothetical protein
MNDSNIALASSAVGFIVSYILLINIRPRWIQVQREDGSRVMAQEKVTLYSVVFGLLSGLAAVVLVGISKANRAESMKLGFRFGSWKPEHIATAASTAGGVTAVLAFAYLRTAKPKHVQDEAEPDKVDMTRLLGLSALYGVIALLFVFVYFEVINQQA